MKDVQPLAVPLALIAEFIARHAAMLAALLG
jgi:hypothetical protein